MAITTTSKQPVRIDAEHYAIESESRPGKIYNLTYNHFNQRWECDKNCPDLKYNGNINCRHVYALRQHIRELKAIQAGDQPVIAQAVAAVEIAQERSLRDEIADLQTDRKTFQNKIDYLTTELALETELRQNQTRVWLETSTKQHERERAIIETLNSNAALIAAQAAEIEHLRQDRKLEIEVSVKTPSKKTQPAKAQKAQPPTPTPAAPAQDIKKMRNGLHMVGGCRVYGTEYAMTCECKEAQSGQHCEHMAALNAFLGVK